MTETEKEPMQIKRFDCLYAPTYSGLLAQLNRLSIQEVYTRVIHIGVEKGNIVAIIDRAPQFMVTPDHTTVDVEVEQCSCGSPLCNACQAQNRENTELQEEKAVKKYRKAESA